MAIEPNMTLDGMRRWLSTDAYAVYSDYHESNVYPTQASSKLSEVVRRARQVIRHGSASKHYDKVTGYLARAVAAYRENGAGSDTFGGVAKNVCALRCWGYDPYGTYTG